MSTEPASDELIILDAARKAADSMRARSGVGELVLVLPRWMWERYGQERLTASFQRLRIQHVELVSTWDEGPAQMLLYQKGTWHTNHAIGETSPTCEGCQVT